MALSADEQALLDQLTAKKSEPAQPENTYDSVEKILEYLVRVSDKFTANPQEREQMLEFLGTLTNPTASNAQTN